MPNAFNTGQTITSANAVFTISQPALFPAPVQIQGFSTDKAWATESVVIAETLMGVDGIMSSGYLPNMVKMTVSLQADSSSKGVFQSIVDNTKNLRDTFYFDGIITLPSTGEVYTFTRGVLENYKAIQDGAKVLQPTEVTICWNYVQKSFQ